MAGKSTFLRQNAHIIILSQIGSYVPAKEAKIGVANKLFSRIGASDNISKGQSTFMVEMLETSNIIKNADAKSFVILDEGQNTTHSQMKMFLTRMGKNAKFIITGDPGQVDLPRNAISGIKEAILILKNTPGVGIVHLDESDVIRNKLVKKIVDAYKNIENNN